MKKFKIKHGAWSRDGTFKGPSLKTHSRVKTGKLTGINISKKSLKKTSKVRFKTLA